MNFFKRRQARETTVRELQSDRKDALRRQKDAVRRLVDAASTVTDDVVKGFE